MHGQSNHGYEVDDDTRQGIRKTNGIAVRVIIDGHEASSEVISISENILLYLCLMCFNNCVPTLLLKRTHLLCKAVSLCKMRCDFSIHSFIRYNQKHTNTQLPSKEREKWGSQWEFLMSCISLSVGLGNVWRFPFTALDNGGGAFIIPYLIVLFAVGKPVYYLEMLIGQFSSRGSVLVYDFAPALRGIGVGQVFATFLVTGYYASLLALIIRYLISSMSAVLPWSYCAEEWRELGCIDSVIKDRRSTTMINNTLDTLRQQTSAEMYF